MNWRRILIIAVVVIVIAAGVYFVLQQRGGQEAAATPAPGAGDVDSIAVDRDVEVVGAEGEVVPQRHAALAVPLSGQVAEIFVAESDRVAKGDPLLRLDSTDQEIALVQAQAGLAQAEANLESAQAGYTAAQAARHMAELGVDAAEAQLALVESGPIDEQIRVSELGVEAANAGVSAAAGNQALVTEGAPSAQLLAAEAQLQAAQAAEKQVREALVDATGDEKDQLEDQLIAAVSNVNAAQAALEEVNRGATEAQRLAASSAVSQAIAQREAAEAQLALVQAGAREEQREVARVAVQQAEATLAETELAESQAQTALAQAEAGIQQAQAGVDAAQTALDLMTLKAPFAGSVAEIAVELGEVASPARPALTLADFDVWLVKTTDLKEQDVVAIARGFPVNVELPWLPGQVARGTVTDIASIGRFEDEFKQTGDILYEVTVRLDDTADLPLRWGMTAFVDINTE